MEELEIFTGVIDDPRSPVEKEQDFRHADVFGTTVVWKEKTNSELRKYTPRFQSTSLSCMGQSGAKGVETQTKKVMSAHPPYRSRANYPQGGMWAQNLGYVLKNIGINYEVDDVSQNIGETLMNRGITVPMTHKIGGYIRANPKNIDEIAQAIETYGHCVLVFHSSIEEWTGKPVYNGKEVDFGHGICATDYFVDNGIKTLYIEDSALPQTSLTPLKNGERYITEEYLKARCDDTVYFTSTNPLELPYIFTKTLRYGSRGFDVKKLQLKLGNLVADGIFGLHTKNSVVRYQESHGLKGDGIVGPLTNNFLNK